MAFNKIVGVLYGASCNSGSTSIKRYASKTVSRRIRTHLSNITLLISRNRSRVGFYRASVSTTRSIRLGR